MKMKRVQDWENLQGEVILVRTDFNVPIEGGIIQDEERIRAALPTIEFLREQNAKVLLMSHLGRPEGKDAGLSLKPIAKALKRELKTSVKFVPDCIGEPVEKAVANMQEGGVVLLENIRFYAEEMENDRTFAKQLVQYADRYVNDAFSVCHRNHTSMNAVAREIPSAAGLLLQHEVKELTYVKETPKQPLVVVMGGIKVKTKIGVIRTMLKKADAVIVGGALSNTILASMKQEMGASLIEEELFSVAKSIVGAENLILPIDVVLEDGSTKPVGSLEKEEKAIDIGPETIAIARDHLRGAKTIVWNGPVGWFENERGAHGTMEIARVISKSKAKVFAGGGETIQALKQAEVLDKIHFVSMGGGAMLAFLEDAMLPGLEPLTT